MIKGIFNPYKKKKENFKSPLDKDNPLNTEYALNNTNKVTIHTGKYILILNINDLEEINDKLGEIIYKLKQVKPEHLLDSGINILSLKTVYQCEPNEVILKTKSGYVSVFIHNINTSTSDSNTDKALQRISYMLYNLNDPKLIETLGITIQIQG